MKDVMLSFGKGLDGYLTKDQIRNSSPLVFADAPTNPDVSNRYLFVNTETIIDDLEKLGWLPVQAAQRKSRKVGSKSMVFNRASTPQVIEKSRKSRFQINGFQ